MLEIEDLHKSYGATRALDGVSLTVRPGQMYGFVGANGAGKSTTMRIAMGVLSADRGTVRWDGRASDFATRRRFGYMPEQRGLYPKMRIADQLTYLARLHDLPLDEARRAADSWLERLQVKAAPTDALQKLSLGNQQRVQLAAALVHDPELLVLDEPFSGLDPVGVDTMSAVLRERCAAGVAVIFSSHQLELVERLCDRVGIIGDGRMVTQGTLDELRAHADVRELEVEIAAADGWYRAVPGVRLARRDRGIWTFTLDHPDRDQDVLSAAASAGRVERFGWRRPPLSELYRDSVVDTSTHDVHEPVETR